MGSKKLLIALKRQLDALLPLPLGVVPAATSLGGGACAVPLQKVPLAHARQSSLPHPEAYSHGLEKIYALEKVDVATVKVLEKTAREANGPRTGCEIEKLSDQNEFDFGPPWRHWITPCFLEEPVQVLGLSKQAEGTLLAQGYCVLREVIDSAEHNALLSIKGLGQGHIDELSQKLTSYLAGRSSRSSVSIEWSAWLRSLVRLVPVKMAHLLLDSYHLGAVLPINGQMSAELRRLTTQEKEQLCLQAIEMLREKSKPLQQRLQDIMSAFLVPWMQKRGGIAVLDELEERLEQVSSDPKCGKNAWQLFSVLLQVEESLFELYLCRVASGVYCIDAAVAADYAAVVKTASSYFYHPHLSYTLQELALWIAREQARNWEGCSLERIAKILRSAPQWSVRKGSGGQLVLREKLSFPLGPVLTKSVLA